MFQIVQSDAKFSWIARTTGVCRPFSAYELSNLSQLYVAYKGGRQNQVKAVKLTIKKLGISLSTAVAFAIFVMLGMAIQSEWRQYQSSRSGAAVADTLSLINQLVLPISLERSVTEVSLSLSDPIPPEFRALLEGQRALARSTFSKLQAQLGTNDAIPNRLRLLAELTELSEKVDAARREADQALTQPASLRNAATAEIPRRIMSTIEQMQYRANLIRDKAMMEAAGISVLDQAAVGIWPCVNSAAVAARNLPS